MQVSGETLRQAWRVLAWVALASVIIGLPKGHAAGDETELWEALTSGGHVALLRHAIAPGTGDPPNFNVDDCATQRNLSDEGRAQARRIGARFRANGIENAQVFSSQWCRCRETAELLELGPVSYLPALNSFYQRWERREPQTEALREWLMHRDLTGAHVLVTHQVNISALTGVSPTSGELVIVRASESGEITVLGTIETE
jgi:phosphohistidine phosphatase SixA